MRLAKNILFRISRLIEANEVSFANKSALFVVEACPKDLPASFFKCPLTSSSEWSFLASGDQLRAKECLASSSFCHLFKPITINTTLTRLFQDATMFEFKRVPLLPNSTFKFLMSEQNLILLGLGIWLGAISVVLFLFLSFFRRLTKGVRDADLIKILDRILKEQGQDTQAIAELNRQVALIKEEGTKHVQKVGLVRF